MTSVRHNLPTLLSSFVGRKAEVEAVAGFVRSHRLVTLTGVGGVGKTRLALRVADAAIEDFPGGVWWVELGSATAGHQIADRLSVAIGFVSTPGADALVSVCTHLQPAGPVLVILDNAEHVLDAAAQAVQLLGSRCSDLHLIVTSREPLGVPEELVWRVPSLSMPRLEATLGREEVLVSDSVRLFLERARSVRPNLVVDDASVPVLATICRRLDGIPLALELAAARVRMMPLSRLSDRLDDVFRLLTGGARTATARHQTLLASISWSVDLLDPVERAVLFRLGVFRWDFALEDAEKVAADDHLVDAYDVLDIVGRLVDKSLVQYDDGTGRFRMLDAIRQFCVDRLHESGELDGARHRYASAVARWCLDVGAGLHGVAKAPIVARMADVAAALTWAYDRAPELVFDITDGLATVRVQCGHSQEFDQTCDWLLTFDRSGPYARRWAATAAATLFPAVAFNRLDLLAVRDEIEQLLPPDDVAQRGLVRFDAMMVALLHGDLDALTRLAETAIAEGNDLSISVDCGVTAALAAVLGRSDVAEPLLEGVRTMTARQGVGFVADTVGPATWGVIWHAINRGSLSDVGEPEEPERPADVVTAAFLAAAMTHLALCRGDRSRFGTVEGWAEGNIGNMRVLAIASMRRDRAIMDEQWDDALEAIGQLNKLAEFAVSTGRYLALHTMVAIEAGQPDVARCWVQERHAASGPLGRPPLADVSLHQAQALLHLDDDRLQDAVAAAHRALEGAVRHRFPLVVIDIVELIAILALRRRNPDTADRLMAAALAERERLGYRLVTVNRSDWRTLADRVEPSAEAMTLPAAVEYARRTRGHRRRPATGWDSLTPTENEVVELVALGLTNPGIADRLYMTVPTVKTHLGHIFTKLGITNRTQLATASNERRQRT